MTVEDTVSRFRFQLGLVGMVRVGSWIVDYIHESTHIDRKESTLECIGFLGFSKFIANKSLDTGLPLHPYLPCLLIFNIFSFSNTLLPLNVAK